MVRDRFWVLVFIGVLGGQAAFAATASGVVSVYKRSGLVEQLTVMRSRVTAMEQTLVDTLKTQGKIKENLKKIQTLLKLQMEEQRLGKARIEELEGVIGDLELRRGQLREKVSLHQRLIRKSLAQVEHSAQEPPRSVQLMERERLEPVRRKVLSRMVERSLREIETLRADIADADQIEGRIQDEKQQLAYLFQDLKEQANVLELNRQLQADLLKRRHEERLSQLEQYHKLKSAEAQVEQMISSFNARMELSRSLESERVATSSLMQSAFGRQKGKLGLPVSGPVLSQFGPSRDPKLRLTVFRKGIEIGATASSAVKAIASGKIAYAGEMPNYGRIAIIDHGDHFYTLCGHLGNLTRKVGETVAAGDPIGVSDEQGLPVYFEIRARNIAVNPLQWVSN